MFKPISLLLAATSCVVAVDGGLDALGFGLSYHTHRDYPWTEVNPGLGVAPYLKIAPGLEAFLAVGGYTNSVNHQTLFCTPAVRYQYKWVGAELGLGWMDVDADYEPRKMVRVFGSVFATAGRFSLHATIIPKTEAAGDAPDTKGAAVWLRFRVV
jgi:hypothetical protein